MRNYLILLVALLVLLCAKPAFAYIDPTSGSYFFQFLLAAILGGLVTLKMFWGRIKAKLFGRRDEPDDPDVE